MSIGRHCFVGMDTWLDDQFPELIVIEDDVTIYANATVLGGETVLGKGCVIGGSLFVTRSVPAYARVALKPPEMRVSPGGGPPTDDPIFDFEI